MTLRRAALTACALVAAACGGTTAGAGAAHRPRTSSTGPSADSAPQVTTAAVPAASWTTFDDGNARTGVGPPNTGITAADAGSLQPRTVTIDGVVDSPAIELASAVSDGAARDIIIVTTSYGSTVAVDARTGHRLWEFRPRHVNAAPGNPQVTTAAPVADPGGRFVYSASSNGFVHKLSVATGRPIWSARATYDATHEKLASDLMVTGRWLLVVTGGYFGDAPPYDGHLMLIDRATGRTGHVWNSECSAIHRLIRAPACAATVTRGGNAIWSRAGAVIEPGSGQILIATGNGPFNGRSNWGDSVLELTPDGSRVLHNWTPADQAELDHTDTDVGSTAPALLPRFGGRRLAVQGGKDGKLRLLDLGRLNGTTGPAGPRTGGELSVTATPGGNGLLTQPAVWGSRGRTYVFVANDSGTAAYVLSDPAHPRLVQVWSKGEGGTSPVIAGGLLYVFDPGGSVAIRQPSSGALVRSLPTPSGHWNSPIVAGGRVIETTGNYHTNAASSALLIWHLPGR